MKMLMLVYNEAIGEEVMEMTASCGGGNYTRIDGIFGKGGTSGTHLGTDIWPGRNNILLLAVSDDEAKKMLAGIKSLRKTLGAEGVKAFVWNLEAVT
ncbi:MAG: hypothetical protein KKG09_03600 [Verrucomicrobia bacterium]|nr:hypothetical protein [Verrucomicrobiota bacterium]MCG2678562.1 hypothetical protein [Kiritimatiellia bacterium]MBU4247477.1 hypothetical protein [Verrucomicrobiota bacterium]MBU4292308.1 hypothetical protein [Verrucomicrobiota bacterium]MBU4430408.1 hypothetical protein [Verrucomicrobiota bacterium]